MKISYFACLPHRKENAVVDELSNKHFLLLISPLLIMLSLNSTLLTLPKSTSS